MPVLLARQHAEEGVMQDFKKLRVWDKGHQLTLAIYKMTARFPKEELYGLTSQMRRAAASIVSNIADGCGRTGGADFAVSYTWLPDRHVNWNTSYFSHVT